MTLTDTVRSLWNRTRRNATMAGAGLALIAATSLSPANPAEVAEVHGRVYDVYTGEAIPGTIVNLNSLADTTDALGWYTIDFTTSGVEEPEPGFVWKKVSGGGCEGSKYVLVPEENAKAKAMYIANMLTFEKDGYWLAQHDMSGLSGVVQVNATLPRNVGAQYEQSTLPDQFGSIWYVINQGVYMKLISHRTQDLPMPVDGDMNSPGDWNLTQASINRLNAVTQTLMGKDWLVLSPGNGHPTRGPPEHQGIYIAHDSFQNQGDCVVNDSQNPEYLIGGIVYMTSSPD